MRNGHVVKLSDYIKKEDILQIRFSQEREWISDSVKDIIDEDDILKIKLMDIFLIENLMVDDYIQCKLIKENIVYIFEGKVLDIGIEEADKIIIKIDNVKKYDNTRYSRRYTVNLCGKLIYNNNESSVYVTVKNLSTSGVSVVSKEKIGVTEEVDIDIILWREKVLSLEGRIVRMFRIGKIYKYGIVIENIEENSKKILNEFIQELEIFEREQLVE